MQQKLTVAMNLPELCNTVLATASINRSERKRERDKGDER